MRTEHGFVIQHARKIPRLLLARAYLPREGGITSWVVRRRQPLLVADEEDVPEGLQLRRHGYRSSSFVSAPILDGRRVLGVINVADHLDATPFDERALKVLLLIASQAAEIVRLHQHLGALRRLIRIDAATGLPDRQALDERLRIELARTRRHELPLSVLLIALDDHAESHTALSPLRGGALRAAAVRCREALRSSDTVYAYDDGQLLAVLPHTDAQQALAPAQRLLRVLGTVQPRARTQAERGVLAHMGICAAPAQAESAELLLARANQALLSARSSGDGVGIWQEDSYPPRQAGGGSAG